MKRNLLILLLAIIASLCLAVGIVGCSDSSESKVETIGLTYQTNSDLQSYSVTSIGEATDNDIVIPDTYNGLPVTGIMENAFSSITGLTSITIPSTITFVGDSAFSGCTNLTTIYWNAYNCTTVGDSLYDGCTALTTFIIGSTVQSLPPDCFAGGTFKIEWTDGNGITKIDAYVFRNYAGDAVTIPSYIVSIGDYAFLGCSSLTGVYITDLAAWLRISFGNYTSNPLYYAGNLYLDSKLVTEIVVPESITHIGYYVFYNFRSLTSIKLHNSITTISDYAFCGCSSLTSITIPEGVTYIGSYAFYDCSSLVSIYIPNEITSINEYTFYGCTSLTSVKIPNSVTSIGDFSFYKCSSLININIPNSITSIGSYAFYNCSSLTSIVVPDSVTSIGSATFGGCSSLQSITLPFIGSSANTTEASSSILFGYIFGTSSYTGGTSTKQYYGSASSTTYYIPSSLVNVTITSGNILYGAFYNCSSLTGITIGEGVSSIGYYAFYNCTALTRIDYYASLCNFFSNNLNHVFEYAGQDGDGIIVTIGANVKEIPAYLFNPYSSASRSPKIVSVVFEDGNVCTSIGNYAFAYLTSLTSINLPNSITSIGSYTFYNCSMLKSITIPNGVSSISSYTFYGCSKLESVTIPDSVTSIGNFAFCRCFKLEYVTIPDSITSIGNSAFAYCDLLANITIGNHVTSIGNSAFENCPSLMSVSIGSYITSIGSSAFFNCTSLTSVYITDLTAWLNISFGNVSANPLANAGNLYLNNMLVTNIVIPENISSIYSYAFAGCTSLTSIVIPNSITSIGQYAFRNCTSLESVYYGDSEDEWNKLSIDSGNTCLISTTRYYYYENEVDVPNDGGNYWHYAEDGVTIVVWGFDED